MNRAVIMIILIALVFGLGACAPGTYVNRNQTDVYQQGPDGRTSRSTVVQTQDMTGSVNANMSGMAAGVAGSIAGNAADVALRTNFGQGFPQDRQILYGGSSNIIIPQMMGNGFGYGSGYGGNNPGFW